MCHAPIGILYTGMVGKKTRCFENLKQPYLCNHLTNFYRIKTKLYVKASSIIVCGKENEGNNLKFRCNMPTYGKLYTFHSFLGLNSTHHLCRFKFDH